MAQPVAGIPESNNPTSLQLVLSPVAQGTSLKLVLDPALPLIRARYSSTQSDLVAAALGPLTCHMVFTSMVAYASFDDFLVAPRPRAYYPSRADPPSCRRNPRSTRDSLRSDAASRLDGDGSPVLTVALSSVRLLRRVTLRVESTLYDGRRSVALFGALEELEQSRGHSG